MVNNSRITPLADSTSNINTLGVLSPTSRRHSSSSAKEVNDLDSLSTVAWDETSYLKLKPFEKLDPTLKRLLTFLDCFGLNVNFIRTGRGSKSKKWSAKLDRYFKILLVTIVGVLSGEVVYDVNIRQSKLLAEQKRSTPLLTFVIVFYSWLTLIIPFICDVSLIFMGTYLFRFYSRTTATVCNGVFFGKKTGVDTWYYYLSVIMVALFDAAAQVVVLGVWPKSLDYYVKAVLLQEKPTTSMLFAVDADNKNNNHISHYNLTSSNYTQSHVLLENIGKGKNIVEQISTSSKNPKIRAYLLDYLLGETYAHSDLGICIKTLCLMIQIIHSYAFFMIIVSLANHYATALNDINDNLDKYEFRKLLKQLIILRDSSEQISLMISVPFASIITLVFMRQIALNGVFIQSTMLSYENWAVSLQSFTCGMSIFMVFYYCDGLQSASKQTHRLKTEQTVINENKGGNQSTYEFLDYLNRLSKSIRITFFNIIAINKSSLVGLYGHILTLTFVTS